MKVITAEAMVESAVEHISFFRGFSFLRRYLISLKGFRCPIDKYEAYQLMASKTGMLLFHRYYRGGNIAQRYD